MLHERHRQWIEARGIDPVLAEKLGLETVQREGGYWLSVPYFEQGKPINHKYRLTSAKDHRMDSGAPLTLWNRDVLESWTNEHPLIVTEGEWDALAVMTAGFDRVVSVPNGAPQQETEDLAEAKRYEFVWRNKALLDKVDRFILATDADDAGRILAADLARLLGPERCMSVTYPEGCKDLNEVLVLHGEAEVARVLSGAKSYPVKGLYRLDDFPEPAPVRSIPVGIDGLADHFALVPGTFSVITGYAGMGKTSLLMSMLANVLKAGVNVAIGSFETLPRPILEQRLKAALYEVDIKDDRVRKRGPADAMLARQLGVIAQLVDDEDTEMDIDYIIELAKVAVLRDGVRLLVLDPWNEIEHKRRSDESETDYTGRAIRALKRFARLYECAVWLVAHPRKPSTDGVPKMPGLYDLSGSANFANKADYGFVVHRPDTTDTQVDVKVTKVRMGLPGKVGKVRLNWRPQFSAYDHVPVNQFDDAV